MTLRRVLLFLFLGYLVRTEEIQVTWGELSVFITIIKKNAG